MAKERSAIARPRAAKKAPADKGKGDRAGAGPAGRAAKPGKGVPKRKTGAAVAKKTSAERTKARTKARTKVRMKPASKANKAAAKKVSGKAAVNGAAPGRARPRKASKPQSMRRPPLKAIPLVMPVIPSLLPPVSPHLDWDDLPPSSPASDLVKRWVSRGEDLLRTLAAHGAGGHEVRADLKEGRFVWVGPDGRVSAEAKTQVVCSWSRSTSVVAMAWIDPLIRASGIARIDGMQSERDDVDEESAWRIAMEAAEACDAEYLYRVPTPHAWYFLALRDLTFTPGQSSFSPGTPVDAVLRGLMETRAAIASRAEPSDVVRERLAGVGSALIHQAEYAYRGTDWVARLTRSGRHLLHLARRLARPTYNTVAAGVRVNEWIERAVAVELLAAIDLLEDEWSAFG
jgi:hypothetical protein